MIYTWRIEYIDNEGNDKTTEFCSEEMKEAIEWFENEFQDEYSDWLIIHRVFNQDDLDEYGYDYWWYKSNPNCHYDLSKAVSVTYKLHARSGRTIDKYFKKSFVNDFSNNNDPRIIEVFNSSGDDHCIVTITRNSIQECNDEIRGQISDGLFENEKIGKYEKLGYVLSRLY